jgi:hypothetical protein
MNPRQSHIFLTSDPGGLMFTTSSDSLPIRKSKPESPDHSSCRSASCHPTIGAISSTTHNTAKARPAYLPLTGCITVSRIRLWLFDLFPTSGLIIWSPLVSKMLPYGLRRKQLLSWIKAQGDGSDR